MQEKYHPVVTRLIDLLKTKNIWYQTFEHDAVKTSEEAAKIRTGYTLQQGAKALLIRVKRSESDRFFAMVVVPGDKRFDSTKVKILFNAKDIRFATEEEILKITDGVQTGGIPPFASLFGLNIFVDSSLFNNERIIFNAGDRRFSIAMFSRDYLAIEKPSVVGII